MKMTRRVLALLLALCLTFGNVMPAMATGLEGEETVVTEETIPVVPEVEETEAPAEAEETEAPAEAEETEAPIVETEEEIVDEAANEAAPIAEMTPAEIVDAAYALAEGTSLEGTYTLTGMVTSIDTAYNSQYGNVTVTIVVEGRESKPIVCYRMKGTGADLIAENDTITVTGTLKNYYGTIEFDTGCSLDSYVKGETPDDAETPAATITFDAANRVSWDTSSQLWECNGITLTNSKGSSTSNVADYVAPARFYKSSSVKIEYPGMTKIVFECSGSKYTLKDADVADLGTVTTVGNTITLELFAPADVIEFTCASNQVRCNEIVIYASGEAVDPEDPTEPEPTEPEPTEPESGIDTAKELQQALYAGGEVVLGGDITADVYVEGGDITLDLRGHVLTVSNFCHTVGGKMTIKDSKGTGKIVGQVQNNLGDLTLEGVTVEGCVAAFGGNVIIDGCTIDNKNDIMGGIGVTVTAANFIDIGATNPKVIIKNSTVKGAPFTLDSGEVIYMWCLHTQDGGILEIQSGNFIGKVQIDSATDVTITGGTFTADISSLLGKGYTQNENGEVVKGDPAADSVLTITEALDLGASKAHNVYTEVKYYVTGEITEVYQTKYGNMKIKDEAGNILTVYGTYSADGSIRYDAMDIKPVAGDTVTVYGIIGQYNGTPQLKNGWITEHVPAPGSELNPVMVTFEMNEDYTEGTATVTIPANKTYYFQAYGVGGMELFVNGASYMMLPSVMGRQPVTFTIENTTGADAEFVLTVTYPAGSQMNPETLYLGSQYTSLAEGNNQGHFYTYTADSDAVLEFSFAEDVAEGAADIAVTNMNTYAQRSIMWDAVDGVATIEVSAGDELRITVVALPDANWNYPAMDLQWNINYPAGSEQNPEMVQFSMNDDYTEGYATVTIPANTTYYFQAYGIGGMELYVNEEFYMVLPSVMGRQPVAFELTNETEEAVSYDLRIAYPAGHQMNPAELMVYTEGESWDISEGKNVAQLSEGNWNGYLFRWFAPKSGELTIDVSNGRAGWSYSITNLNTYEQTDLHSSYDVPNVNTETITVNAGDEIMISVNTCGASYSDVTPAGEVYFTATFVPVVGTEENPIQIEWNWNETWSEATATVTVPANTSIFASFTNGGMMLTINDGEPVEITGNGWMPQVLEFKGAEEGETVYNLKMFSPVGSFDNPAELVIGENSCELAENSNGYIYKWTADSDGELTITMGADVESWSYCVNNLTTSMYGDTYSSTDEEIVSSYTVAVAAGDEIQITINTPFSYDTWSSPAGTVTFTADFAIPEGAEGNPMPVMFEMNEDYTQGYASVTVPAYTTYYYQSRGIGGMELYVNGEYYMELPAVMGRQPVVFSVTNDTMEEMVYELSVCWAIGSQMNPEYLYWWNKSTSVELAEGDSDGYYYTHTAHATGPVEFFLHDAMNFETGEGIAADIIVTNMNTYEQKVMSYDGVDGVMTMDVTEGDELQIIVTAQPDENWEYPAAYINWGYWYENDSGNDYPAATSIQINKGYTDEGMWVVDEENVTEMTYVANADIQPVLTALVGPETALQDVTWKSSNEKVLTVNTYNAWVDNNQMQVAYLNPVVNPKTGKVGTGTVTLTATANDGSGVKATVNVNVVLETKEINIYPKNDQWQIVPGKSATMMAEVYTWYNQAPTNDDITWEIAETKVFDFENYEWIPYEGDAASVATINNKGVVKAANVDKVYEVTIRATAQDNGMVAESTIYVAPPAKKGVVEDVPATYDVNFGEPVQPWAYFSDAYGNEAFTGYTWTSSNKNIVEIVQVEEYDEEQDMWYAYDVLEFKGKTGKVTLTATANDGSRAKATWTINVVKGATDIEMVEEASVAAGKTLTIKATPAVYDYETETYNYDVSDKTILWNAKIVERSEVEDEWGNVWEDWVEVKQDIGLKITNGKLSTNAKKITGTEPITVMVTATAKQANGYGYNAEATCIVTVYPATKQVDLVKSGEIVSKKTLTVEESNYIVLDAEGAPVGEYIWTSSNEKVAIVENNADGSVTIRSAGKMGKATITATANDGTKKSAKVTVNFVKAVEEIYFPEDLFLRVAKGKSVNFSKIAVVGPTDASNKKLTWSMEWVEPVADEEGYIVDYVTKGDGKVPTTVATMSNGSVKAVMKNVTDFEYVRITATAADKFGASCEAIVVLAPNAIKGLELYLVKDLEAEKYINYANKTYDTTDSQVVLAPSATNDADDLIASGLTFSVTNKNFEVVWGDEGIVIKAVEGAANPYGKVTVTMKTTDGGNASTKITINFQKPEA